MHPLVNIGNLNMVKAARITLRTGPRRPSLGVPAMVQEKKVDTSQGEKAGLSLATYSPLALISSHLDLHRDLQLPSCFSRKKVSGGAAHNARGANAGLACIWLSKENAGVLVVLESRAGTSVQASAVVVVPETNHKTIEGIKKRRKAVQEPVMSWQQCQPS
eukprot:1154015-Pelagomonas_calceolata.AAC.5